MRGKVVIGTRQDQLRAMVRGWVLFPWLPAVTATVICLVWYNELRCGWKLLLACVTALAFCLLLLVARYLHFQNGGPRDDFLRYLGRQLEEEDTPGWEVWLNEQKDGSGTRRPFIVMYHQRTSLLVHYLPSVSRDGVDMLILDGTHLVGARRDFHYADPPNFVDVFDEVCRRTGRTTWVNRERGQAWPTFRLRGPTTPTSRE